MRRLLTTLIATLAMATIAWGQATFDVHYYDVPKGGRPHEEFQRFPSDRASANVRQMLGRTGEVWGAESGVDRLVVISTSGMGS